MFVLHMCRRDFLSRLVKRFTRKNSVKIVFIASRIAVGTLAIVNEDV